MDTDGKGVDLVMAGTRALARSVRRRRTDDGAAALEFALVSVPLLTLLLGMLQYGLYFNDSLNTRQGVREGARLGVVQTFSSCGGAGTDGGKLQCMTKDQIGALTGPVYTKVSAPEGWERGNPLVVCAVVDSDGGIGLLPMPHGGFITSITQMSIEQDETEPTGLPRSDALPAGAAWPGGC